MDFDVVSISVNELQLFNIPEVVEDFESSNVSVKDAGVFKVLLEPSIRGQGTPHEFFLDFDEHRLQAAEKQTVIAFRHFPNVFGLRSFEKSMPDSDTELGDCNQGGISTPLTPCSPEDIHKFVTTLRNASSYVMSHCCSKAKEASGTEMVNHFFNTVLPQMALSDHPSKTLLQQKVIKQGQHDATSMNKFFKGLLSMPVEQKQQIIDISVENDARLTSNFCKCPGCTIEDVTGQDGKDFVGVMYGSDIQINVKDKIRMTKHFGLYCLASTSLLRLLPCHYPGITLPFLYFGSPHSLFPAHCEDYSLYSWNYLHYGAPKVWLVIPPRDVRRFHNCLSSSSPNIRHSNCQNVLGHKYFIVTPSWLDENRISYKVVVQNPGESVVLCPNAVNLGFNTGYNVAEACKFATKSWIPYGIVAPKCNCLCNEAHLDLERVVAAIRPDLLKDYWEQKIPFVAEEQDPNFYNCILKSPNANLSSDQSQIQDDFENEDHNTVMKDYMNVEHVFPDLPSRPKGRKNVFCPKPSCMKQFAQGKKQRMINHIEKYHKSDPNFPDYITKLLDLFPPRNKTKRTICNLCGKSIAGRATHLRNHQLSSTCKR